MRGRPADRTTAPSSTPSDPVTMPTSESVDKTVVQTSLRGRELLADPVLNKGMGFSLEERAALGLRGLLPAAVHSLEEQASRVYWQYSQVPDDMGKAALLADLHNRNQTLFYRVLLDHMQEMLPIVYTPTIGSVIQQYSRFFVRPTGVYLSIDASGALEQALANYGRAA